MKIYFVGSIRGGRVDADLYRRIIGYLQQKHIVLTEHVGSPELNLNEQHSRDAKIYMQDMNWRTQKKSENRATYSTTGS